MRPESRKTVSGCVFGCMDGIFKKIFTPGTAGTQLEVILLEAEMEL
jgi:hypothetical protein